MKKLTREEVFNRLHSSNSDLSNLDLSNLDLSNLRNSNIYFCLLYTSPSPRDRTRSRMPSSA